VSLSQVIDLQQ